MEHITVREIGNDYKQLIPNNGYLLKYRDRIYSEAVVKDTAGWSAIPIN